MMTSPGSHPVGTEHVVGLDHTDAGGRQVVMVGFHQAGVLGGLTAEQRAARPHAALGDTADDRAQPLGDRAADRDVVLQKQRLGAANHQVVDHHRHQVHADGVVLVHRLRDRQLRADAIGGGCEQRFAVAAAKGEQPGESTETATHLGPGGLVASGLNKFDGAVAGVNVHPGGRVRDAGCAQLVSVGLSGVRHRDKGYRAVLMGRYQMPNAVRGNRRADSRQRPTGTSGKSWPARSPSSDPRAAVSQHLLDDVLAQHGLAGQLDRVLAVEAGGTEPRSRLLGCRDQTPQRDVAQRVGADGMPHRLEHFLFVFDRVGDQLGGRREVDAVEAGPLDRW